MVTGVVRIQFQLLPLEAVLHVATGAIQFVVQGFRHTRQIGAEIARIGPYGSVLDFGDDAPLPIPGSCPIPELAKLANLATKLQKTISGILL